MRVKALSQRRKLIILLSCLNRDFSVSIQDLLPLNRLETVVKDDNLVMLRTLSDQLQDNLTQIIQHQSNSLLITKHQT